MTAGAIRRQIRVGQTGGMNVKNAAIAFVLLFATMPALAAKSCDELKNEIEAKLKTKNVQGYSLEVMASADVKEQKVVGSCEAGSKKIVYKKA